MMAKSQAKAENKAVENMEVARPKLSSKLWNNLLRPKDNIDLLQTDRLLLLHAKV